MDEIETTDDSEVQCIKEWDPELAANPMFGCLCPRCFPFSFAAIQAEMLQEVRNDGRDQNP